MSTENKPLFRPDAVKPRLRGFEPPELAPSGSQKLASWAQLLASRQAERLKETELLADFIRDLFADLLGFVPPPASPYTLKREALVKVDGKFADAALGVFAVEQGRFAARCAGVSWRIGGVPASCLPHGCDQFIYPTSAHSQWH